MNSMFEFPNIIKDRMFNILKIRKIINITNTRYHLDNNEQICNEASNFKTSKILEFIINAIFLTFTV
jgi:hypothetical protein